MAEESTETVQWSNADIEFPSTSTSDEIEIISQQDDETICKLLSALPIPSETVHSPNEIDETVENPNVAIANTEAVVNNEVFSKFSFLIMVLMVHIFSIFCIESFSVARLHSKKKKK